MREGQDNNQPDRVDSASGSGAESTRGQASARKLPWGMIATGVSLAVALASLGLSKRSDDRSAATEREVQRVEVEVVGATLPVLGQFVARPEIRVAVSAAISNASLRGVIVRDARLELDERQVGCVIGWVSQDDLSKVKITASAPPQVEDPLPLALPSRAVLNVAFLFVVKRKGFYPQCKDNPAFRRLARRGLTPLAVQAGQRRLRLVLEIVPRQRVSVPVDVVFCTPRFRPGSRPAPAAPSTRVPLAPPARSGGAPPAGSEDVAPAQSADAAPAQSGGALGGLKGNNADCE